MIYSDVRVIKRDISQIKSLNNSLTRTESKINIKCEKVLEYKNVCLYNRYIPILTVYLHHVLCIGRELEFANTK